MEKNKQEINQKPRKHYEQWDARDDDFLARNYLVKSIEYIAMKLGRTIYAVQRRVVDLGLSRRTNRRLWKTSEIRFLREHYAEHGAKWCARHLTRTEKSVLCMANECRLKYNSSREWSDDDVIDLQMLWRKKYSVPAIAQKLSRSSYAVGHKAHRIGLRRRDKVIIGTNVK